MRFTLTALSAAAIAMLSQTSFAAGDAATGRSKFEACLDCHGCNGQSQMPPVAGLVVPNIV
jgi:cytochrome c2